MAASAAAGAVQAGSQLIGSIISGFGVDSNTNVEAEAEVESKTKGKTFSDLVRESQQAETGSTRTTGSEQRNLLDTRTEQRNLLDTRSEQRSDLQTRDLSTVSGLKIDEAGIMSRINQILGGTQGLAAAFAPQNASGMYNTTGAAAAGGNVIQKVAGELAALTGQQYSKEGGTVGTTGGTTGTTAQTGGTTGTSAQTGGTTSTSDYVRNLLTAQTGSEKQTQTQDTTSTQKQKQKQKTVVDQEGAMDKLGDALKPENIGDRLNVRLPPVTEWRL